MRKTVGKWQDRLKAVEKTASSFRSSPLCSPYKPRLSRPGQPPSVWRLFPRQSAAIAFRQHSRQDVHVFSLEKEDADAGQREFLVTSYSELWHYYSSHRRSLAHCYELIEEGAVCKLYFDLEFHRPSNTHRDGKRMVADLIKMVCVKLKEVYGIICCTKDVFNLDSSSPDKFSRHLIFMLHNAAFKDNSHVGRFVHHILRPASRQLRQRNGSDDSEDRDLSQNFLVVKSKGGEDQLFVDLGVYTKNRNFRLYKSSKLGKSVAFTVAADNEFASLVSPHTTEEERMFLASLVTNVSFTGQRILTFDETHTNICPVTLPRDTHIYDLTSDQKSSPFRDVDQYVLTLVCKDGVEGQIRRWSYFSSDQLLIYDIAKFRWCHNVKRFHKSNNIMIVVDLRQEVWYQRCHDPDCRKQNYRSSSYALPQEICLSHILMEDEEDQELLSAELENVTSDAPDDLDCLVALQEVESAAEQEADEDMPDWILLQAAAQCE